MWLPVAQQISTVTGRAFVVRSVRPVAGGCINNATIIEDDDRRFFVKHNRTDRLDMFRAEAAGLLEITASLTVRVPKPICWGRTDELSYIVLEHLMLHNGDRAAEQFGWQLAAMHQIERQHFGWHIENTIGSTPQHNAPHPDWIEFWRSRRVGFQLELAGRNGYHSLQPRGARLLEALPGFFRGYQPRPALLHGDLWSGNYAADGSGQPVVFDPAVYYGDRETDVAMTELFGGFPERFYAAYREALPLDPGYTTRRHLYNLYHILNHLNLFGPSYLSRAEMLIDRLLAEV